MAGDFLVVQHHFEVFFWGVVLDFFTLQGTNISYLGKRKLIDSKVPAGRGICDRSQEGDRFKTIFFPNVFFLPNSRHRSGSTSTGIKAVGVKKLVDEAVLLGFNA